MAVYKQQDKYFVHEQEWLRGKNAKRGFNSIQDINGITTTIGPKRYTKLKKKLI